MVHLASCQRDSRHRQSCVANGVADRSEHAGAHELSLEGVATAHACGADSLATRLRGRLSAGQLAGGMTVYAVDNAVDPVQRIVGCPLSLALHALMPHAPTLRRRHGAD